MKIKLTPMKERILFALMLALPLVVALASMAPAGRAG